MKIKNFISKNLKNPGTQLLCEYSNLADLFCSRAVELKDHPFLCHRAKASEAFQTISYGVVLEKAGLLASHLIALGVRLGDRVVLASENRPEWAIADFAIMLAGAIPVPAYATNSVEDHRHIIMDSESNVVICSKTQLERIEAAVSKSPSSHHSIILLDEAKGPYIHAESKIAMADREIKARIAAIKAEDICCLIYTSGTGGRPKGVMISHRAVFSILEGATKILSSLGLNRERFLSFLPLSHAYENVVGLFWPLALGAEIYYAGPPDRLLDDMAAVRPTIMTAVPRLYEVIHQKIERQLSKASKLQRQLFAWTQDLGIKAQRGQLALWEYPLNLVMELLVRQKIRKKFGGHLKAFVSGGAALDPEIGRYFLAMGIRILQGYGQTETSPVVSVNLPWKNKIETVGPPLPNVEIKIAEDGEIKARGPNLMLGYWRDEKSTQQAIVDGWLHTGDLGIIDEDGFLRITGRKKDIIVLSGGDTISPVKIEQELCREPEIEQAMVEGRDHLVALIVPATRIDGSSKSNPLHDVVGLAVEKVNRRLAQNEKIRRFQLIEEAFTIDNQMLTPTLKIRRHIIRQVYGSVLEKLLG